MFIMRWLVNINMTPYINQKAVLYYVTKYCIKTEMKTMKSDKLIKDLLLYIFSKNSISLLMIKFTNKLIRKRNISVQEVYYLFLQLDLTNLFFLVSNMNIWSLKKFIYALPFINKDSIPKNTYLEKYCSRDKEVEARMLYKMYMLYN